jgi:hypothetical protein
MNWSDRIQSMKKQTLAPAESRAGAVSVQSLSDIHRRRIKGIVVAVWALNPPLIDDLSTIRTLESSHRRVPPERSGKSGRLTFLASSTEGSGVWSRRTLDAFYDHSFSWKLSASKAVLRASSLG